MLLKTKSAIKFITFYVAIMICLKGNAFLLTYTYTFKCLLPFLLFVFNLFSEVKRTSKYSCQVYSKMTIISAWSFILKSLTSSKVLYTDVITFPVILKVSAYLYLFILLVVSNKIVEDLELLVTQLWELASFMGH